MRELMVRLCSIQPPEDSSVAQTGHHTDWFFSERGVVEDENNRNIDQRHFDLVEIMFLGLYEKLSESVQVQTFAIMSTKNMIFKF